LDESEHGLPEDAETMMSQVDVENLAGVALGALSPDQRAVMELAYYQGMHYGEIAELLGCPENTVKTRMFHARKKLRSLLPALLGGTCSKPRQESMP
jgi:RNA polymerase sigma-70 factor (ECF subfamily)